MTTTGSGYGAHARTSEAIDARERVEAAALRERQAHNRQSVAPGTPAAQQLAERHAREREGLDAKYAAERTALKRDHARAAERAATADAQRDADLAPIKAERRRAFLLQNPDASDASFEWYWDRIADDEAATVREGQVERARREIQANARYSA